MLAGGEGGEGNDRDLDLGAATGREEEDCRMPARKQTGEILIECGTVGGPRHETRYLGEFTSEPLTGIGSVSRPCRRW
jgi:hypothetical protein